MKHKKITGSTDIRYNESYVADSIEIKVERIFQNKEGIDESAPIIYTERKEGVLPAFNIRSDRFEIAQEATDKISRSRIAERQKRIADAEDTAKGIQGDGGGSAA